MTGEAISRTALPVGLLAVLAMMSYGCEKKSHNLKYVACNPDKTVNVEIKNVKAVPQVAPVDEYVFVCPGDKVRWFTDDDNLTFTTQFDVPGAAKTNDLFESGTSSIPSKPNTNASDKNGHKQATDAEIVSTKVTPFKDYSYKVIATDKSGKPVATNDPHVIPMGNGGP
jgi:hypothetical protein